MSNIAKLKKKALELEQKKAEVDKQLATKEADLMAV